MAKSQSNKLIFFLLFVGFFALLLKQNVHAFHKGIYQPRVPDKILRKARMVKNPFFATMKRFAKGKEIYFGKGMCVLCHSKDGKGVMVPGHSPRDFSDKKWQELRTDGELMWVLKNGSPGTGMPALVGKVINEEEGWNVILFIRAFKGRKDN